MLQAHTGKRRWFVLNGSDLHYFDSDSDKTANGVIDLKQAKQIDEVESDSPKTFRIVVPSRVYLLRAPDDAELGDWLACLHEATASASSSASVRRRNRFSDSSVVFCCFCSLARLLSSFCSRL